MEMGGFLKKKISFSMRLVSTNASPDPSPATFPADVRFDVYPPALTSPSHLGVRHVHEEKISTTEGGETTSEVTPRPSCPGHGGAALGVAATRSTHRPARLRRQLIRGGNEGSWLCYLRPLPNNRRATAGEMESCQLLGS